MIGNGAVVIEREVRKPDTLDVREVIWFGMESFLGRFGLSGKQERKRFLEALVSEALEMRAEL